MDKGKKAAILTAVTAYMQIEAEGASEVTPSPPRIRINPWSLAGRLESMRSWTSWSSRSGMARKAM